MNQSKSIQSINTFNEGQRVLDIDDLAQRGAAAKPGKRRITWAAPVAVRLMSSCQCVAPFSRVSLLGIMFKRIMGCYTRTKPKISICNMPENLSCPGPWSWLPGPNSSTRKMFQWWNTTQLAYTTGPSRQEQSHVEKCHRCHRSIHGVRFDKMGVHG
jgi:hypothetical protein